MARSGRRWQPGERGIDEVPGDTGSLDERSAAAVQRAGQGRRPQVLHQQHGRRGARVEFRSHEADVIGADQAPDLGVDLEEAGQVLEFVELHGSDVAGAVLGDKDEVEDADYLLVGKVRELRSYFVAPIAIRERDDEILNGSSEVISAIFI